MLEGVFENIQSDGLTVQMKQMSHRDRPLAKVTVRDMDVPRLPKPDGFLLLVAGQEEEDGTPALPLAPPWRPSPHFRDGGDEVTPQASQKPKAVRSWVCGNELLQEKYLDASRETQCLPPPF